MTAIALKVFRFINAPTSIYEHVPSHRILSIYRPVVLILFLLMLVNVLALLFDAAEHRRAALALAREPDNILILTAFASLLILSLSESGEEARLVIHILPMLAALPLVKAAQIGAQPRTRFAVVGMLGSGLLLLLVSISTDFVKGQPFQVGRRQVTLFLAGMLCLFLGLRNSRQTRRVDARGR